MERNLLMRMVTRGSAYLTLAQVREIMQILSKGSGSKQHNHSHQRAEEKRRGPGEEEEEEEEEEDVVEKLFRDHDDDGDGALDCREFKRSIRSIAEETISEEDLERMFEEADWDGGGSISELELNTFLGGRRDERTKRSTAAFTSEAQERIELIVCSYNRLVEGTSRSRELLLLLENEMERKEAEKRLGLDLVFFSQSNPTGFYDINLADPVQREVLSPPPASFDV
eukprot:746115-Hanusia_phi.AAC.1